MGDSVARVTCVLHHHIGVESPFEAGLDITTSRDAYEAHIEWMEQRYNFISLDQLLSGDLPPKPLLLTFDDVYRSVLDVAREVLAPRGIPSVFFLNPGLLEDGAISFDSTLAWAANTAGIGAVCRLLGLPERASVGEVVAEDMATLGAAERAGVKDRLLQEYGPPDLSVRAPLISAGDLTELVSLGVEIGNHTMTHVRCRSLSEEEREIEIVQAKAKLEELSAQNIRSFSIPYGYEDDLTDAVLQCARSSGHSAIFLVHARDNWRRPESDVWYRTSLRNEHPHELRKMVSIMPFLRMVKKTAMRS